MTAALAKIQKWKVIKSAFLLGSVAPDLPLYCLSFGTFAWLRYLEDWPPRQIFRLMFDELFFHNPFWITLHNSLHAPLILLFGITLIWLKRKSLVAVQQSWLFWFFSACLLHTVVDIITHNDDGPLVWFPFNWTIRFASPVSYWDSDHFGREFSQFELWFDLVLVVFLLGSWIRDFVIKNRKLKTNDDNLET